MVPRSELMPLALLATLSAALMTVSCDRGRNAGALSPANEQSSVPPSIRYEDHLWAGGIEPPAGELHNPHTVDADSAKAGKRLFTSMNCDGCHGDAGSGWVGPSLADGRWRYGARDEEIFNSIFYGRPKGMPAYGGVIGSEGVWMLVNYLMSIRKPDTVPTQSWIETSDRCGLVRHNDGSNSIRSREWDWQEEKSIWIRCCAGRLHSLSCYRQESCWARLFGMSRRNIDNKMGQSSGSLTAPKTVAREYGAVFRCRRIPPWTIKTSTSSSSRFYRSNERIEPGWWGETWPPARTASRMNRHIAFWCLQSRTQLARESPGTR